MNHDSEIMQSAWIEQGALAAGMYGLVTQPRTVIGEVIEGVTLRIATGRRPPQLNPAAKKQSQCGRGLSSYCDGLIDLEFLQFPPRRASEGVAQDQPSRSNNRQIPSHTLYILKLQSGGAADLCLSIRFLNTVAFATSRSNAHIEPHKKMATITPNANTARCPILEFRRNDDALLSVHSWQITFTSSIGFCVRMVIAAAFAHSAAANAEAFSLHDKREARPSLTPYQFSLFITLMIGGATIIKAPCAIAA
jgi:hypothetical protein